ncbi:hypothetical protein GTE58_004865 [Salmonella enterica subsp. enterica]|nr:hypothetical protein [Salmonella enterica subsp. enterica]EDX0561047.1 hypothetical protein [Salmonella enterica subsp. enterica]
MTLIGQFCPPIDFLDDYFSLTVRFRTVGLQTPHTEENVFIAEGGNEYDGAKCWVVFQES